MVKADLHFYCKIKSRLVEKTVHRYSADVELPEAQVVERAFRSALLGKGNMFTMVFGNGTAKTSIACKSSLNFYCSHSIVFSYFFFHFRAFSQQLVS